MKICFKCQKLKPLADYYKHPKMTDGHLGKCKKCAKKDITENRDKKIEQYRKYDRQRSKLPHRRENASIISKRYKKENPLRCKASEILNNAKRSGRIKKPKKCSICKQKLRIYGHHEDYSKPLCVIWCCQACHKKLHKIGA